jgi:hypothetical protein
MCKGQSPASAACKANPFPKGLESGHGYRPKPRACRRTEQVRAPRLCFSTPCSPPLSLGRQHSGHLQIQHEQVGNLSSLFALPPPSRSSCTEDTAEGNTYTHTCLCWVSLSPTPFYFMSGLSVLCHLSTSVDVARGVGVSIKPLSSLRNQVCFLLSARQADLPSEPLYQPFCFLLSETGLYKATFPRWVIP